MPVSNEKFDQLKIDKLKHFLEDMAAKGNPRPYEIFVDNLKWCRKQMTQRILRTMNTT